MQRKTQIPCSAIGHARRKIDTERDMHVITIDALQKSVRQNYNKLVSPLSLLYKEIQRNLTLSIRKLKPQEVAVTTFLPLYSLQF